MNFSANRCKMGEEFEGVKNVMNSMFVVGPCRDILLPWSAMGGVMTLVDGGGSGIYLSGLDAWKPPTKTCRLGLRANRCTKSRFGERFTVRPSCEIYSAH